MLTHSETQCGGSQAAARWNEIGAGGKAAAARQAALHAMKCLGSHRDHWDLGMLLKALLWGDAHLDAGAAAG